jgi:hypothetical protein
LIDRSVDSEVPRRLDFGQDAAVTAAPGRGGLERAQAKIACSLIVQSDSIRPPKAER